MAEMVTDAEAQRMREDCGASAFALHGRVQRLLADRERLLDVLAEAQRCEHGAYCGDHDHYQTALCKAWSALLHEAGRLK